MHSAWQIEECFQAAKDQVGLDHYQVRRWDAWYRYVTLVLVAQAFLAAVTDQARTPTPPGLIPLTCNEVQHLCAALIAQAADDPRHRLRWSAWRRRQQARARTCHYQRQAAWQP